MGVYKRPEKEWRNGKPIWYYQFTHEKRRHYEGGFSTKKDAATAEAKKVRDLKSKRSRPIAKRDASLPQLMDRFIAFRNLGKPDDAPKRDIRRSRPLTKYFKHHRPHEISASNVQQYIEKRSRTDKLANRTVNLEMTLLRSFFKYAIQNGYCDHNPTDGIKNLPEIRQERWFPTEEQFLRFVEAAKTTTTAKYLVPWIYFRAYTGTRPKESFYMEWDDIDFENDEIRIRPKNGNPLKNRKVRYIDMHPELKRVLLEWRTEWNEIHARWLRREKTEASRKKRGRLRDHQWVFIRPFDHGRRACGYHKSFYAARKKAGLPKMTSHTLRHFFVARCIMSGIDLFTIKTWTGHSSTMMIEDVYGHIDSKFRKKQMAKFRIGG